MSDKHYMGERLTTGDLGDFELDGLGLTLKQIRFVQEYIRTGNGTAAAIAAGYSENTAAEISSENLRKPQIRKAIADRLVAAAKAAGVTAAAVIAEIYDLAFADRSEVMQLIVRPCPKCWPAGLTLDDPNPLCDQPVIVEGVNVGGCGGGGFQIVKLTPTKKLSRNAAKLINSMKQKKDGSIEIEMFSREKAIELLGRACGVFKDVRELSGPNGGPLQVAPAAPAPITHMTNEELEALLLKQGRPLPPKQLTDGGQTR